MNDSINLVCVIIIAFIIFYLIFKDYKECENFEEPEKAQQMKKQEPEKEQSNTEEPKKAQSNTEEPKKAQQKETEFICNYAIDNIIINFFEKSKKNKLYKYKLNRILEYTESEENEDIIQEIINDKHNIYTMLKSKNYIIEKEEKYYIKDNQTIEINLEYIIKLLQKYKKEKEDNIIIKVVKNSEVFDEGIIDIGKVLVSLVGNN